MYVPEVCIGPGKAQPSRIIIKQTVSANMAPRININKKQTKKTVQAFCLRRVHCSSRDSSRPRVFTHLSFFLLYTSVLFHDTLSQKSLYFPEKAHKSVSTMLLSTMLTKTNMYAAGSKDKNKKEKQKLRHKYYTCLG